MFASRHTAEFTMRRMAQPLNLTRHLRLALAAQVQRRALSRLDDARLCDLGLSRADAEAEANRPAWDVPPSWLR